MLEEERAFRLKPIRMTVKELEGNYSNILWKKYFDTYLKPFHTIKDDDIILINDASYFEQFNNLIKHFSKRDQANYLIWKVVEGFLNNYVGSIKNKMDKSEKCYNYVNDIFDNSFGMLYIRKIFNASSVASITDEMVSNIFEQFNKVLEKVKIYEPLYKRMTFIIFSSLFLFTLLFLFLFRLIGWTLRPRVRCSKNLNQCSLYVQVYSILIVMTRLTNTTRIWK